MPLIHSAALRNSLQLLTHVADPDTTCTAAWYSTVQHCLAQGVHTKSKHRVVHVDACGALWACHVLCLGCTLFCHTCLCRTVSTPLSGGTPLTVGMPLSGTPLSSPSPTSAVLDSPCDTVEFDVRPGVDVAHLTPQRRLVLALCGWYDPDCSRCGAHPPNVWRLRAGGYSVHIRGFQLLWGCYTFSESPRKRLFGEVWVNGGHEAIFWSTGGKLLNSSTFRPAAGQAAQGESQLCCPYSSNILSVGSHVILGWICCVCAEAICKVAPLNSTICWLI